MPLLTEVPDALRFRGLAPAVGARSFAIALDDAHPSGGGALSGRIERRGRPDPRPIAVTVSCAAAWLDVAPQVVGRRRFLSWSTYGDIRNRAVPIWLDEQVYADRAELGPLDDVNWRRFSFALPDGLPRAFEGTFVAFRWRVEARRPRRIGADAASVPLLFEEPRTIPVVRVETSPIGTWRLLEWRSEAEEPAHAGPCFVDYERRRPEDMPLPGETRERELGRRLAG